MTDIFTKEKRSWIMSRIRGTNTKIDLEMNKMLGNTRYKYEMYPKILGNSNLIIPRKKIAIFCDGDFWHG
jgi:DNA mismatch endonuclease (patch repair protein)